MANLTVPQLIKIVLGIFVVVVVVVGIFLFFRGNVIDFFKNLVGVEEEGEYGGVGVSGDVGGEEDSSVGGEVEELPRPCEDCEVDGDCSRRECNSIRKECDFVWVVFGKNRCVTVNN